MRRLSTIARRARYRKPPPQEQQLQAIRAYRDRLDHLADAGGAYLVLPYGLLDQLTVEQQLQVVHIVKEVARSNPSGLRTPPIRSCIGCGCILLT